MKIFTQDVTQAFDVDGTLVFWVPTGKEPPKNALEVDYYGDRVFVVPHEEHIQLLRANLARGRNVIVWSGNGYKWAENVLRALGFKKSDQISVMTKPSSYVDDLPCADWMGNRVYIKPHNNPWSGD